MTKGYFSYEGEIQCHKTDIVKDSPKKIEMLQLRIDRMTFLAPMNKCLYVFLFLFVWVCFFFLKISVYSTCCCLEQLLKELVECFHQTMFSWKMLMLSDVLVLRTFNPIKTSSGSWASGKAAHREEQSQHSGSPPSLRTRCPRLIRCLLS